jgi:hypothetical protein
MQPHNILRLNAHRLKNPYNEQMNSYLHRLGLYQMVIMGDYQLDKSMLTALVERWRPDVNVSSTSRRDYSDVGGCLLPMEIA